jgi:hypothetical protein
MASYPAAATQGRLVPFELAGGDGGVESIQSLTPRISLVSGTVHLVAYRILARPTSLVISVDYTLDPTTSGSPRLYDNTVPWRILWPGSAGVAYWANGSLTVAQGQR